MRDLSKLCRKHSAIRQGFSTWQEPSCDRFSPDLPELTSFDTLGMTAHLVKIRPLIDGVGIPQAHQGHPWRLHQPQ